MELSRIETGKEKRNRRELVNYKFDSSENERKHVTYEYEKKYYDAIKREIVIISKVRCMTSCICMMKLESWLREALSRRSIWLRQDLR